MMASALAFVAASVLCTVFVQPLVTSFSVSVYDVPPL